MGYQGDLRTAALGDVLSYCQHAPAQECIATLKSLSEMLQIPLVDLLRLPVGAYMSGPDAAGATVTENPVLVAGKDQGNLLRALLVNPSGIVFSISQNVDDLNNNHSMLGDRTGILAVAPPVSKMWSVGQNLTGVGTPSATKAAPGSGLRHVILAWGISMACGATAIAANQQASISGTAGAPVYATACPVNDSRIILGVGPVLIDANSPTTIAGPTQPAGAVGAVWMSGYIASFP